MSANRGLHRARRAALVVAICIVSASAVEARDPSEAIASPWVDPLNTHPAALDRGTVFPGDSASLNCEPNDQMLGQLTLAAAVDLALCRNPHISESWATIKVQAAALGEARAAYLPTASIGLGRERDRTWYPSGGLDNTSTTANSKNATVTLRLFDFGERSANRLSASSMVTAAFSDYDAMLQKTLSNVVSAYFDAQTAQASWQARVTNEALIRQTLEATQRREARGASARSDTLQAATTLAKATLERNRAFGASRKSLSILVYELGLPPAAEVTLAEDVSEPVDGLREALGLWLEEAQTQHPSIVAARAQLDSARHKVEATAAQGLPTLDISGSYYTNGRPNQGLSGYSSHETVVNLTLNIPLFEGFGRTYKVRGAQAQVEQKEAQLLDVEHQVLMDVVKAHADALSAVDNLAASQYLLDTAQSALASVQRKFDKGASDFLEILNSQSALSDARLERIRCLADWRSAKLRLLASAGVLKRQAFDHHPTTSLSQVNKD